MDSIINLILRGQDDGASSALESVTGKIGGLGGILQNAAGFAVGGLITSGINAVKNSMGDLFEGMVGGNAAFEQYNTQFEVMLGSTEAAQQRMQDLADFGASTPFELPGVVEADRILQGFGLHSEEAAERFGFSGEQIRTLAGDVASGTGSSFQEMAGLIGRFSAGATGEAISRMQELGIANRNELAQMGLEFASSGQLLSPLPEAMNVVLNLMQEKYGGMMDAQSSTFSGMMSNLEDWKAGTLRTLGEPIFEVLKDRLGDTLAFLGSPEVQGAITTFATSLADGIGTAIDWLNTTGIPTMQTFVGWIQTNLPTILPIVQGVAGAFAAFTVISTVAGWITGLIAAWGALSAGITAAGGVITAIVAVLGGPLTIAIGAIAAVVGLLTIAWNNNWGDIQGKTQAAITFIQTTINTALNAIQNFWQVHGDTIISIAQTAWDFITAIVETGMGVINSIISTITLALEGDWRGFGESLREGTIAAWTGIQNAITTAKDSIINIVANLIQDAIARFRETDWGSVGRGIIDGIASGISSGIGAITSAARNAAQAALDAAKGSLGISSPSTVAAQLIGAPFTQGIAVGAVDAIGAASRQIQGGLNNLVNNVSLAPLSPTNRLSTRQPTPALAGATFSQTTAPTVIHHTYQVTINDTRAMTLFLDYLETIQSQATG